jgi:hypothetical protein
MQHAKNWGDAHEVIVLVPDTYEGTSIQIPVDRHSQRATLVGAIAGGSSTVRAIVIVDCVLMEADIRCVGYSPEKVDISQPNRDSAVAKPSNMAKLSSIAFSQFIWPKRQTG